MPSPLDIIETYNKLFQSIWAKTVPTLGVTSFAAILERALFVAQQKFPFLSAIKVRGEGVYLEDLKSKISTGSITQDQLETAFREYTADLVSILAKIMGEVISNEVKKLVDTSTASVPYK